MENALRLRDEFPINLTIEWYYEWLHQKFNLKEANPAEVAKCAEKVRYWAEVANAVYTHDERKLQLYLITAHLHAEKDINRSIDLCWDTIRHAVWRKEGWGHLAEYELIKGAETGNYTVANMASEIMAALKPAPTGTVPQSKKFSGWEGLLLRTRCLRAAGDKDKARKQEDAVFKANGARFSLLHATRGRWEKALATKSNFFKSAVLPLGVEHIFAIDADDQDSIDHLKHHRHVIVPGGPASLGGGCVEAWNTAAADSSGAVLVQLSDDWLPCIHWDEYIWQALEAGAKARGAALPIADVPLVLAISDNHRTDALLCMAILTRARYKQQRELFHHGYTGVYSDTEFTVRAHDDGVVVQARHIVFDHQHPLFAGVPLEQMDETYRRQNAPERYAHGKALFNTRNPRHAQP